MAKKKKHLGKTDDDAVKLPAFGGFKPLSGLESFKAKLDAEEKAKKEAPKQSAGSSAASSPKARPAASSAKPAARTPEQTAEDELSFHRMMMGVTPLDQAASRVPVSTEARSERARVPHAEVRAKAKAEAEAVLDHLRHLVDDTVRFEVSDDGSHVEGRRLDAPPGLVRALRRGELPIDGRLDLHGLAPDAAREQVVEFLRTMRTRGERCVLVIHGKGEGVLRGEIAAWLSQGRAREHVAAFATARQEDGGAGAVYVALRAAGGSRS